jgi:hypothetical protein
VQADVYTRMLLTVIAASLVVLVARGFLMAGGQDTPSGGGLEASLGRYRLVPIRGAVWRINTETGEAWRARLQGDGGEQWMRVAEPEAVGRATQPAAREEVGETLP